MVFTRTTQVRAVVAISHSLQDTAATGRLSPCVHVDRAFHDPLSSSSRRLLDTVLGFHALVFTLLIWNESVPIHLAQCWFPGSVISNAKI